VEPSEYREIWRAKPSLRTIYEDFYDDIAAACVPGTTLEIGGGSGNLKSVRPDVISIDLQATSWLDAVADAQQLPFADATFDNIVMVDVLHHIEFPVLFIEEAGRLLRPGGHVIALEPAITPFSSPFYRFLHDEPVNMTEDPFKKGTPNPSRDPLASNQAIPTIMFVKQAARFADLVPNFDLLSGETRYKSMFAYPMSGGFKSWTLIASSFVRPVLKLEEALLPYLGRFMAFRLFVVLEKKEPNRSG